MPVAIPWKKLLPLLALAGAPMLLGSAGLNDNLDQRVLAAHNRERIATGIPALVWDEGLAQSARAYAAKMSATGEFKHSDDEPGVEPQGENLWAGTPGYYSPESMVGLWVAEKRDFKPGVFPMNSRTGDIEAVGHYTQLMWRRSSAVGCALAHGRAEDFLVCRYSTAGNVVGQLPY